MTVLVAGCSLSSGWGLNDPTEAWPSLVCQKIQSSLHSVAQTGASNQDIFLSAIRTQDCKYDLRLIQWTALNRITVSPSPVNERVVLSYHNQFIEDALPGVSPSEVKTFTKLLSLLNQDWKPYFDLVDMIEILQQDPKTYFINGMLPWDQEFFTEDWTIPLATPNTFLESLLQVTEFNDSELEQLLKRVIQARNRIDQSRWINLTNSLESAKVDTVSATDPHPGAKSQIKYADEILNYIFVRGAKFCFFQ